MLQNVNIKKLSLFFNMIHFSSECINYVKCPITLLNIHCNSIQFIYPSRALKEKQEYCTCTMKPKKNQNDMHNLHVSTYNMKIEYSSGCSISLT